MEFTQLSLYDHAILLLAAIVLFTSFIMLAQPRIVPLIHAFAWQGVLPAVTTAMVADDTDHPHLYNSAGLNLALKALLIPWMLHRLAVRLNIHRDIEAVRYPSLTLLAGASLVVFSYYVAIPIVQLSALVTRNAIAIRNSSASSTPSRRRSPDARRSTLSSTTMPPTNIPRCANG